MPNIAKKTVNASPDNRPIAVSLNPRSRRIGSINTENMIRSMELERLTILRINKSLRLPLFMSGTHLESGGLVIWLVLISVGAARLSLSRQQLIDDTRRAASA